MSFRFGQAGCCAVELTRTENGSKIKRWPIFNTYQGKKNTFSPKHSSPLHSSLKRERKRNAKSRKPGAGADLCVPLGTEWFMGWLVLLQTPPTCHHDSGNFSPSLGREQPSPLSLRGPERLPPRAGSNKVGIRACWQISASWNCLVGGFAERLISPKLKLRWEKRYSWDAWHFLSFKGKSYSVWQPGPLSGQVLPWDCWVPSRAQQVLRICCACWGRLPNIQSIPFHWIWKYVWENWGTDLHFQKVDLLRGSVTRFSQPLSQWLPLEWTWKHVLGTVASPDLKDAAV